MNQNPEQLGGFLLESDFQRGGNVMHARERRVVGESAMAGDVNMVSHPLDVHVVNVKDLRKFAGNGLQALLQPCILPEFSALLDGCRLTLDVSKNRRYLRQFTLNVAF